MIAPASLSKIEPLEARIAPATVSAGLSGATLKITALSSDAAVTALLEQIDSTTFQLIDDGSDPVVFEGVKNIQVQLSNAKDTFDYKAATKLRGSFTIKGGAGDDDVRIYGAGSIGGKVSLTFDGKSEAAVGVGVYLLDNLNLSAPAGKLSLYGDVESLTLNVSSADLETGSNVYGKVRATAPADGSNFRFAGTIHGSLTVIGNAGRDKVDLLGETRGKITLTLGEGNNEVIATGSQVSMSNGLTYRGGSGSDNVDFNLPGSFPATVVGGAVKIHLGDGSNTVRFMTSGGIFSGSIQINGGSGKDTVIGSGGNSLNVLGAVRLNLGDGENAFAPGSGFLGGGLQYRGGMDRDSIGMLSGIIGGNTKLILGDGGNEVYLILTELNGNITILGGDNDVDFVTLGSEKIRGKVSISLGDGPNGASLSGVFHAGINYKGGTGTDNLLVAGSIIGGALNFNGGNGNNSLTLDATSKLVGYRGGADSDYVEISSNAGQFLRGNIKLGAGDDLAVVDIGFFTTLRVDGGAGTDIIRRLAAAVTAGLIDTGFETINPI